MGLNQLVLKAKKKPSRKAKRKQQRIEKKKRRATHQVKKAEKTAVESTEVQFSITGRHR